jgi:DNA replicative helicase MCM subunit Mcm2 (Cdc46/Mcm family)
VITIDALSQVLRRNPNEPLQHIVPRLLDAKPTVSFNAIKSNIIGRLVNIQGNVIRVGPSKPLVQSCHFMCPKCGISIYQSKEWACHAGVNVLAPLLTPSCGALQSLKTGCSIRPRPVQRRNATASTLSCAERPP